MIMKNECINCEGIKRLCPFKEYKGKRNNITGFYIAHIEENKTSCIMYYGFMNKEGD